MQPILHRIGNEKHEDSKDEEDVVTVQVGNFVVAFDDQIENRFDQWLVFEMKS